jgi:HEPN domain-containing protein
MDRKAVRKIVGLSFADQQTNEQSWLKSANSFHEGASLLGRHQDSISGGIRVFLLNAALSIELLLKAILVAGGKEAPGTHNLLELAHEAKVVYSRDQETTLKLLAEMLKWAGRYPVPKRENAWDHYYDQVLEPHVIREGTGARRNPKTFPSVENYEELWDLAKRRWNQIELDKGTLPNGG